MLISYAEVENAYQSIKQSSMFSATVVLGVMIGAVITIVNLLRQYQKSLEDGQDFQYKAFFQLLKPLFFYALVATLAPVLFSFLERLLSELELSIRESVAAEYFVGNEDQIMQTQLDAIEEDYKDAAWYEMIGKSFKTSLIVMMSEFIAFCDQYLLSFVIAGRYLYLIFLELVAPIVIIMSLLEETRSWLWSWMKQMLVCYLLVPGFLIAHELATSIVRVWAEGGYYGFMMLLASIALKIYLYRQAQKYITGLFS